LNTYGYVASNPLRYTDRFGLLDPNKPLQLKPKLNPIKPAPPGGGAGVMTGLGKALGALGLMLHSEPVGEGSDIPDSQCFDDDPCEELKRLIDQAWKRLRRAIRNQKKDLGKKGGGLGHLQNFNDTKTYLRTLIAQAESLGCDIDQRAYMFLEREFPPL